MSMYLQQLQSVPSPLHSPSLPPSSPDCNLLHKVARLIEDLHARPLVPPVAHDKFGAGPHHGHLPRIPQLALVLAGHAELELERARLLKHLDPVVVRVRHHNLLVHAQTEAVRRVELALGRAQRTELATDLHRCRLGPPRHSNPPLATADSRRLGSSSANTSYST